MNGTSVKILTEKYFGESLVLSTLDVESSAEKANEKWARKSKMLNIIILIILFTPELNSFIIKIIEVPTRIRTI